ncbi:MAG: decaprenyl-phosphate phosphoribosyltransferase [Capsulimonadaceae bacterium]
MVEPTGIPQERENMAVPPARRRSFPMAMLVALRPKQWTKNLLLFAGLLFTLDKGHTWHDLMVVLAAFVCFCLVSSVVYLVNDVVDRESDRRHPRKCARPIACGEVSPGAALAMAVVLALVGVGWAFVLRPVFGALTVVYLGVTSLYSFKFKHVVILDLLLLAAFFVLRAMAGTAVIDVKMSPWLLLCTLMLSLFLGIAKRRAELIGVQQNGALNTRPILQEYTADMLDQMIVIVTSACIMSYCLYTIQSPTASSHHWLIITIPFVLYGIFRYLYLMHRHSLGEAPDAVLIEDRPTVVNLVLWGITTVVAITHTLDHWMSYLPR